MAVKPERVASDAEIEAFCQSLAETWKLCPHMRFGQLVTNIGRDTEGEMQDGWYWQNADWLKKIWSYGRRYERPRRQI